MDSDWDDEEQRAHEALLAATAAEAARVRSEPRDGHGQDVRTDPKRTRVLLLSPDARRAVEQRRALEPHVRVLRVASTAEVAAVPPGWVPDGILLDLRGWPEFGVDWVEALWAAVGEVPVLALGVSCSRMRHQLVSLGAGRVQVLAPDKETSPRLRRFAHRVGSWPRFEALLDRYALRQGLSSREREIVALGFLVEREDLPAALHRSCSLVDQRVRDIKRKCGTNGLAGVYAELLAEELYPLG